MKDTELKSGRFSVNSSFECKRLENVKVSKCRKSSLPPLTAARVEAEREADEVPGIHTSASDGGGASSTSMA